MDLNLGKLLGLPAADRLALAEILRQSVGCPADVELLDLPAWQRERFERVLQWCGGGADDLATRGPVAGTQSGDP